MLKLLEKRCPSRQPIAKQSTWSTGSARGGSSMKFNARNGSPEGPSSLAGSRRGRARPNSTDGNDRASGDLVRQASTRPDAASDGSPQGPAEPGRREYTTAHFMAVIMLQSAIRGYLVRHDKQGVQRAPSSVDATSEVAPTSTSRFDIFQTIRKWCVLSLLHVVIAAPLPWCGEVTSLGRSRQERWVERQAAKQAASGRPEFEPSPAHDAAQRGALKQAGLARAGPRG